jgi:hypothetical protein
MTQLIVECSLAAYTIGWCAFLGLMIVHSRAPASPARRAFRFIRPTRTHCARRASVNV